uniref:Uncharacterized protein n=1 Tax=Rhizophora mucronata TaxID=61149 RepID=A0A2P2P230_RHIMU
MKTIWELLNLITFKFTSSLFQILCITASKDLTKKRPYRQTLMY